MANEIHHGAVVRCQDGRLGTLFNVFRDRVQDNVTDIVVQDERRGETYLIDGTAITDVSPDGTVMLSCSVAQVLKRDSDSARTTPQRGDIGASRETGATTVPLMEEQLVAQRQERLAGEVTVRKVAESGETSMDVSVSRDNLTIERQAVDEAAPADSAEPYWDGETLIVPIVEERLFVEKRRVVVEKVRIRRESSEEVKTVRGTVMRERLEIDPGGLESQVEQLGRPATTNGEPTQDAGTVGS